MTKNRNAKLSAREAKISGESYPQRVADNKELINPEKSVLVDIDGINPKIVKFDTKSEALEYSKRIPDCQYLGIPFTTLFDISKEAIGFRDSSQDSIFLFSDGSEMVTNQFGLPAQSKFSFVRTKDSSASVKILEAISSSSMSYGTKNIRILPERLLSNANILESTTVIDLSNSQMPDVFEIAKRDNSARGDLRLCKALMHILNTSVEESKTFPFRNNLEYLTNRVNGSNVDLVSIASVFDNNLKDIVVVLSNNPTTAFNQASTLIYTFRWFLLDRDSAHSISIYDLLNGEPDYFVENNLESAIESLADEVYAIKNENVGITLSNMANLFRNNYHPRVFSDDDLIIAAGSNPEIKFFNIQNEIGRSFECTVKLNQ